MSKKTISAQQANTRLAESVTIGETELQKGAVEFQRFWLRPLTAKGKTVPLRLRINKRFGGWRLKDELVEALGLTVGDCINTEVTVLFGSNLIEDEDDVDLFADGSAANWLIDILSEKDTPIGSIIDCYVEFSYCEAPVGGLSGKMIKKASLILKEGIRFVRTERIEHIAKPGIGGLLSEIERITTDNQ